MQYLTVTRDIEGESGIVNLKVSDILFLEWSTRAERVVVHTRVGEYYMTGILKYWTSVLNNSGFTFRVVDRNSAVNVNQIEMLDSNLKIAYFDTHDLSKSCTMAIMRYKKLENEFMVCKSSIKIVT